MLNFVRSMLGHLSDRLCRHRCSIDTEAFDLQTEDTLLVRFCPDCWTSWPI